MIINLQKFDTLKVQLTIAISLISSKDIDEECVMHSKSDNVEFMPYGNTKEVVDELFESFLSRYLNGFKTSIRLSEFIFNLVQLLYYKCHRINLKCGGSFINSPDWIKKKKEKVNLKNDDDKCFQCAKTIFATALNFQEIKKKTTKIFKC